MFIWILALIVLAVYLVVLWASLGDRLHGRNLALVIAWGTVAMLGWRTAVSVLGLHGILSFVIFLLLLGVGYFHLQKRNPVSQKRALKRKPAKRKKRQAKHH